MSDSEEFEVQYGDGDSDRSHRETVQAFSANVADSVDSHSPPNSFVPRAEFEKIKEKVYNMDKEVSIIDRSLSGTQDNIKLMFDSIKEKNTDLSTSVKELKVDVGDRYDKLEVKYDKLDTKIGGLGNRISIIGGIIIAVLAIIGFLQTRPNNPQPTPTSQTSSQPTTTQPTYTPQPIPPSGLPIKSPQAPNQ